MQIYGVEESSTDEAAPHSIMATILDLALPDGSNLLADLQHTPAKPEKDSHANKSGNDPRAAAADKGHGDGEARNELVFKLVKKDGGFAIPIGTHEAKVLLAMLAAGAKAP